MNGEITRNQLIDLLRELVEKRRTSTLYVRTDDNHLIVASVERGEIVSLLCGPRKGERAIPSIRKMRTGTYRMEESVTAHRRLGANLPPSEVLFSLMLEGGNEEETDEAGGTAVSDCQWVQDVLCKMLAEYMGPIAPLVCRETVKAAGGIDSSDKVKRVVETLSQEIDNPSEAERFRSRARTELGKRMA